MILGLAGDDQRCPRLVDQDRVDLVDDGVGEAALHALVRRVDHVVAQVVETEFVVGAVSDVGGVGHLLLVVRHLRQVHPHRQAEETVDAAHPVGIAFGKVVVDRDDMDALAGNRVEIDRQRRRKGLAFAGAHFGDLAVMQDHAADQLHVEMAHAEHAAAGLAHHGERLRQQGVQPLALFMAAAELAGPGLQRLVRERADGGFERVDARDSLGILLDQAVIATAEDLLEKAGDHGVRSRKSAGKGKTAILAWEGKPPRISALRRAAIGRTACRRFSPGAGSDRGSAPCHESALRNADAARSNDRWNPLRRRSGRA